MDGCLNESIAVIRLLSGVSILSTTWRCKDFVCILSALCKITVCPLKDYRFDRIHINPALCGVGCVISTNKTVRRCGWGGQWSLVHRASYQIPQPPYFTVVRKESAEVDAVPLLPSFVLAWKEEKEKGMTGKHGEFVCGKLCVTSIFNTAVLPARESLNVIGNPAIERNKGEDSKWTYLLLSHVWSHAAHTYTATLYMLLTPQAG